MNEDELIRRWLRCGVKLERRAVQKPRPAGDPIFEQLAAARDERAERGEDRMHPWVGLPDGIEHIG